MTNRSSQLRKARIYAVDRSPEHNPVGSVQVRCMFNPYEYTVSKANNFYVAHSVNGQNTPRVQFAGGNAQTLHLNLLFDTYGTGQDVRTETDKLWEFMAVQPVRGQNDQMPPMVAFDWGSFFFVSYITQMSQRFTLFSKDGIPVRATVNVTFTQYVDTRDYPPSNPTSGTEAIDRSWRVIGADRLDNIAADVYGDAGKWRLIATYNEIGDPLGVVAGQMLLIPIENTGSRP